jgi:hypothetical protein
MQPDDPLLNCCQYTPVVHEVDIAWLDLTITGLGGIRSAALHKWRWDGEGLHREYAIGGVQFLADTSLIASLVSLKSPLVDFVTGFTLGVNYVGFLGQPHDLIVSGPSQTGGLTGAAVSLFDLDLSPSNANWLAIHRSVTQESPISRPRNRSSERLGQV